MGPATRGGVRLERTPYREGCLCHGLPLPVPLDYLITGLAYGSVSYVKPITHVPFHPALTVLLT